MKSPNRSLKASLNSEEEWYAAESIVFRLISKPIVKTYSIGVRLCYR